MLSDAQRFYIEEVLGFDPGSLRLRSSPVEPVVVSTIVVLTPPLQSGARAMLQKILASIGLDEYEHVEGDGAVAAEHVLHFAAGAIPGRSTTAHGTCWGFHDLARLLGGGPEVTQLKREVWTLLRAFAKEVRS